MIAITAWASGLLIAIGNATALPVHIRLAVAVLAMALIGPAALRVVCGRGPAAVRRLVWERDGTWSVTLSGGLVERGCRLGGASAAAGPLIWLALRGRRLHHTILDRSRQDPVAIAALRRRLQAERHGS